MTLYRVTTRPPPLPCASKHLSLYSQLQVQDLNTSSLGKTRRETIKRKWRGGERKPQMVTLAELIRKKIKWRNENKK